MIVNIPKLDSDKLKLALIQYGNMLRNRKTFSEIEEIEEEYLERFKPLPKVEPRTILSKTEEELSSEQKDIILNNNQELLDLFSSVTKSNQEVIEDIQIQSEYEKMYDKTSGLNEVSNKLNDVLENLESDSDSNDTNLRYLGDLGGTLVPKVLIKRDEEGNLILDYQNNKPLEEELEEISSDEDPVFDDEEDFEEEDFEEEEFEEEEFDDEDPVFDDEDPVFDDEDPVFDEEEDFEEEDLEEEETPGDSTASYEEYDNIFDDEEDSDDTDESDDTSISEEDNENVFDDLEDDFDDFEDTSDGEEEDIIQEEYEESEIKPIKTQPKHIPSVGRNIYKQALNESKHDDPYNRKIDKTSKSATDIKKLVNIPKTVVPEKKQKVIDRLKSDYINNPEVIPRESRSFVAKYRGIKYSEAKNYIPAKEIDKSLRQGDIILKNNRLW